MLKPWKTMGSKALWSLFYVLPILLLVYALSIGPFLVITSKIEESADSSVTEAELMKYEEWGETFYTPLVWVINTHPACGDLFNSYVNFCVMLFDLPED
ncbi:hypothetical protein [Gimesia panareensis]|uniref:hypothetical protein n=1 Tax=Gimesia panareensis TaxID=2527978 RepID=UPI0011888776|nr:hypothetical protein [Gimesia panareensis]QDU49527.1 hypothetical protein Pan110_18650 [Gimesia panareensis]